MDNYAIYLRKSRADMEAEARGEGETLERHRTALYALAKRRGLNVVKEYSELITGDSIAARPQMQLLLDDVKHGLYKGVIVNDVDRLGRGDSIDQEIIKYSFIAGHCIIITPGRDINPATPSDEDMLDFSMFFARFEYRKIAQRLNQGRTRSAASGNYISARVPFGYKKVVDGKKITLEPDKNTAGIVKMMFEWYASKEYGYYGIAKKLNEMGIRTYRNYPFSRITVKNMLQNPIYTGRIVWGKTSTIPEIIDGHRRKRHIKSTPTVIENAHPAIIDDDLFNKVQDMFRESRHTSSKNTNATLKNPFAGILYCSQCGRAMYLRGRLYRNNERVITCVNPDCNTVGTYLSVVTNSVLEIMRGLSAAYQEPMPEPPKVDNTRKIALQSKAELIEGQLKKAQELVEIGVYTPSEYLQRKGELLASLNSVNEQIEEATTVDIHEAIRLILPQIQYVLDAFPLAGSVEEQNELLKSVFARIEYTKTVVTSKNVSPDSLVKLKVFPRIGNSL